MSTKKRGIIAFVLVLFLVGLFFCCKEFFYQEGNSDKKEIIVGVVAEDAGILEARPYETSAETLGDFCRTWEICDWEESMYGLYIVGISGITESSADETWWSITVGDEKALTGADGIILEDGEIYTFTFEHGY